MFRFDCQHRLGSQSPAVCLWQSQRLGQVAYTSYLFCDQCPLNVRDNGDENKDFLKKCFNRRYDSSFLKKLYNKYTSPTHIVVPDIWNSINSFFANYKQYSWFIDIGLTGSFIVDKISNHKDIDIIFWITNVEDYVEWSKNNSLPIYFQNYKIDYYIFLEPYYQFFVSLWPNTKKLYINNYFSKNFITTDSSIDIVYNNWYYKFLSESDII